MEGLNVATLPLNYKITERLIPIDPRFKNHRLPTTLQNQSRGRLERLSFKEKYVIYKSNKRSMPKKHPRKDYIHSIWTLSSRLAISKADMQKFPLSQKISSNKVPTEN